jgi:hypothetical protein
MLWESYLGFPSAIRMYCWLPNTKSSGKCGLGQSWIRRKILNQSLSDFWVSYLKCQQWNKQFELHRILAKQQSNEVHCKLKTRVLWFPLGLWHLFRFFCHTFPWEQKQSRTVFRLFCHLTFNVNSQNNFDYLDVSFEIQNQIRCIVLISCQINKFANETEKSWSSPVFLKKKEN